MLQKVIHHGSYDKIIYNTDTGRPEYALSENETVLHMIIINHTTKEIQISGGVLTLNTSIDISEYIDQIK